jgi:hypothetical protein
MLKIILPVVTLSLSVHPDLSIRPQKFLRRIACFSHEARYEQAISGGSVTTQPRTPSLRKRA